jgi:hypothetical protein
VVEKYVKDEPLEYTIMKLITIYHTSLKPNENIHFYHAIDLMHIITHQQANLVHITFNKHKIASSFNFTSTSLEKSIHHAGPRGTP